MSSDKINRELTLQVCIKTSSAMAPMTLGSDRVPCVEVIQHVSPIQSSSHPHHVSLSHLLT